MLGGNRCTLTRSGEEKRSAGTREKRLSYSTSRAANNIIRTVIFTHSLMTGPKREANHQYVIRSHVKSIFLSTIAPPVGLSVKYLLELMTQQPSLLWLEPRGNPAALLALRIDVKKRFINI